MAPSFPLCSGGQVARYRPSPIAACAAPSGSLCSPPPPHAGEEPNGAPPPRSGGGGPCEAWWRGALPRGLRAGTDTALGDDPPLVDQLAWGHFLECRLDGGADRGLVGRGAGEVGIEIDPGVRVQRHHRQIIGLVG